MKGYFWLILMIVDYQGIPLATLINITMANSTSIYPSFVDTSVSRFGKISPVFAKC